MKIDESEIRQATNNFVTSPPIDYKGEKVERIVSDFLLLPDEERSHLIEFSYILLHCQQKNIDENAKLINVFINLTKEL
jgi:hypothetical protein